LVLRYLEHVRVEKRLAARTLALYTLDLEKLQASAEQAGVSLTAVTPVDMRRWVAQMHGGGRSGRGIALILSGWRGFYGWLGREGLVSLNPVQDLRAPKVAKPLPKALSVDEAVQLADFQTADTDAHPGLQARDECLTELLYGCGLRIGELVGLDALASAQAQGWIDLQAAEAHVLGKGGKRRSVPVGSKALQALTDWLAVRSEWLSADPEAAQAAGGALFISHRGTRLTPQHIRVRLKLRSLRVLARSLVHEHAVELDVLQLALMILFEAADAHVADPLSAHLF
jgi:integrase/recombinase XerC